VARPAEIPSVDLTIANVIDGC